MIPPRDNPFRVDRVSTLPFFGADVGQLADRFLQLRQAAIVGRHGAGKSTLARAIAGELQRRGHAVRCNVLPSSASAFEQRAFTKQRVGPSSITLFDGYEQLSFLQRLAVRRRCPVLLVTAHRETRLPTLLHVRASEQTLECILNALLGSVTEEKRAEVSQSFIRHRGNVREVLMELYDTAGQLQR